MTTMEIDPMREQRRRFMTRTLPGLVGLTVGSGYVQARQVAPHLVLSACEHPDGRHFLLATDLQGKRRFRHETSFRGHGMALSPDGSKVLLFARRPGTSAVMMDLNSGETSPVLNCPANRHFYGHGCFSADGSLLFSSENVFDSEFTLHQGVTGVWDARDFSRLGEIPSGGVGPHELAVMPDGKTLVIANGGIHTHPELGRRKLNIPDMQPVLSYVDIAAAKVVETMKLADRHLSIRHLSVAEDATVAVALQDQKATARRARSNPLVVLHRRGSDAVQLFANDTVQQQFSGYMASVCVSSATGVVGASSPRGGVLSFWQMSTGRFLAAIDMPGVSGLALSADKKYFVASSDQGELRFIDVRSLQVSGGMKKADRLWDNHLLVT